MDRRTFFAALAGLPFVRWFVPKAAPVVITEGLGAGVPRLIRGGCHLGKTLTGPYRVIPYSGKSSVQTALLAMYLNRTAKPGEIEARYAEAFEKAVIRPVAAEPLWSALKSP